MARRRTKGQRLGWGVILLMALAILGWAYYQNQSHPYDPGVAVEDVTKASEPQILVGRGSAQFPLYAPQYPGSAIIGATRFADTTGTTMIASLTTADNEVDVTEFYRRELSKAGFNPKLRTIKGTTSLVGERPSAGLSVLIGVTVDADGQTRIDVTDTSTIAPR